MLIGLIIIILALIGANLRIVNQANTMIIERLGKYHTTWDPGIHVKIPFIDRIVKRIDMKEQVADFPPQPVITKDNVSMNIDTVVYYRIFDPQLYCYGVTNPIMAIENLTATTLRNIIGELELDETLTSRDTINGKMCSLLDEATDPWGIKIGRVELKNIIPPRDIQDSMERQMRAERERREAILRAEGEKKAAILKAEGEKEAAVLSAEAQKVQLVKEAEGHAESIRLHKQAEADGVRMTKEAEAQGVELLKNAGLSMDQIVSLKSFEAFTLASNGKATKIIIPSDIQNLSGTVAALKGVAEDTTTAK